MRCSTIDVEVIANAMWLKYEGHSMLEMPCMSVLMTKKSQSPLDLRTIWALQIYMSKLAAITKRK